MSTAIVTRPRTPAPAGVTSPGGLEVVVRPADDLTPGERAEWVALEESAVNANPFLVPEWVTGWYEAYVPRSSDRVVLLVRHPKTRALLGVAPLYLQQLKAGPLRLARRLVPVGSGRYTPFELPGYLAAEGQHRDVLRVLVQETVRLGAHWSHVAIAPDQSWFEPEHLMASSTEESPVEFYQELLSRACVVLRLGKTWEETHAGLKRNLKESLRRSRNRLAKSGLPHTVHRRTGASLDAEAVLRLLDLHRDRSDNDRAGVAHPDYYADAQSQQLLLQAVPQLARRGRATVYELELDGRIVAAQLVLHGSGSTYAHSSGFRPEVWSYGAVTHLLAAAVQDAVERGDSLVNFSPGPRVSKLRWSDECWIWHEFAYGVGTRRALRRYLVLRSGAALSPPMAGVIWNRRSSSALEG